MLEIALALLGALWLVISLLNVYTVYWRFPQDRDVGLMLYAVVWGLFWPVFYVMLLYSVVKERIKRERRW